MTTGCSYRSIFATATYDEIRSMYWPLHEAPESKFVAIFDEMRTERAKATNLRTLREAAGLSQSQLAKASGVGVRSIQLYEQRQKDINKAQGIALYLSLIHIWSTWCPLLVNLHIMPDGAACRRLRWGR